MYFLLIYRVPMSVTMSLAEWDSLLFRYEPRSTKSLTSMLLPKGAIEAPLRTQRVQGLVVGKELSIETETNAWMSLVLSPKRMVPTEENFALMDRVRAVGLLPEVFDPRGGWEGRWLQAKTTVTAQGLLVSATIDATTEASAPGHLLIPTGQLVQIRKKDDTFAAFEAIMEELAKKRA